MAGLTLAGAVHTVLAMFGIAIGLFQLLRPKGGAIHRARGYAFVYAMLIADGAAMLVFQFTGSFNILHVGRWRIWLASSSRWFPYCRARGRQTGGISIITGC